MIKIAEILIGSEMHSMVHYARIKAIMTRW